MSKSTEGPAKTLKQEPQTHQNALIVPAELAERLMMMLGEMPMKFVEIIDPIAKELQKCSRGDITITPEDKP